MGEYHKPPRKKQITVLTPTAHQLIPVVIASIALSRI
jgi:hypothetical protein